MCKARSYVTRQSCNLMLTGLDLEIAPDGFRKPRAKVFNGTYPGPLIGKTVLEHHTLID